MYFNILQKKQYPVHARSRWLMKKRKLSTTHFKSLTFNLSQLKIKPNFNDNTSCKRDATLSFSQHVPSEDDSEKIKFN